MAELKLTALQDRFFLAVLQGASPEQAIRAARGPHGRPLAGKTAKTLGNAMMKVPAVQAALASARARLAERAELTVLDLVDQLMETRALAHSIDPPQLSAAVAASMGAAKLLGLVIDRSQVEHLRSKPALVPTKELELSEDEWRRQFSPSSMPVPTGKMS
jgi:hypothetical protein